MPKIHLPLFWCLWFFASASAQPRQRAKKLQIAEATEIMHCLRARGLTWLGDAVPAIAKGKRLRVGLRHDRKTYPGQDVVFVVVFESPMRGDVFELTREDRSPPQNVQSGKQRQLHAKHSRDTMAQ